MTIKHKIALGLGFALTAVISFIIGGITIYDLKESWVRQVRVVRDIDFARDNISLDASDSYIEGYVKKGSVGKQTMNKGSVVYIQFPVVLRDKDIEYVK